MKTSNRARSLGVRRVVVRATHGQREVTNRRLVDTSGFAWVASGFSFSSRGLLPARTTHLAAGFLRRMTLDLTG